MVITATCQRLISSSFHCKRLFAGINFERGMVWEPRDGWANYSCCMLSKQLACCLPSWFAYFLALQHDCSREFKLNVILTFTQCLGQWAKKQHNLTSTIARQAWRAQLNACSQSLWQDMDLCIMCSYNMLLMESRFLCVLVKRILRRCCIVRTILW